MTDFLLNYEAGAKVYDIETFPNTFTANFECVDSDRSWSFEISDRTNDIAELHQFITLMRDNRDEGVGFNNLHFDYPVLHFIYHHSDAMLTARDIYTKAMQIINAPHNAKFAHMVWESDWIFPQVDLFKVHHFDNVAKATSLKVLEFNMRADAVEDLPFEVGTVLAPEQVPVLRTYNRWDVKQTKAFLKHSGSQIAMRRSLSVKLGVNLMNCSDVKIGEKILIKALEDQGVRCHTYDINNRRVKLQTHRDSIDLGKVIFPYVKFEREEFQQVHSELASKVITNTKGVFTDMVAHVDGLTYKFGTGGLHASVDAEVIRSTDTHQLVDVDVASYYPNLGIKNKLYPAHLGEGFCVAYNDVYLTRKQYPKGAPENEGYKLALNGSYGNSNNDYSALKDPQYTMSITINGQLLLCVLIEQLLKVPGLRMVQANTDGVTYLCPREYLDHTRQVARWWEQLTQLELEEVLYKRMWVRDVNNYIAEREDGKIKRIGAYAYETALENPGTRELPWHKDWSFRVVAKAAEAYLVHGVSLREFIESHADAYDFMGRTKVPRSSKLLWGGKEVPNIVRYYVSTTGKKLEKLMPAAGPIGEYKKANGVPDYLYQQTMKEIGPAIHDERIHTKNKSTYADRLIGIHTGWKVRVCNRLTENGTVVDVFDDIDYDFYVQEAKKLVALTEG